jgi:aflatoxin B1 aldehyde reductase
MTAAMSTFPKLVLGSMEFGRKCDQAASETQVQHFLDAANGDSTACVEVDTALMYAGGETEKIIGRFPPALTARINVATKANPWDVEHGKLTAAGVGAQLDASLTSLDAKEVDLFYLHAPDHDVDILETLAAVDAAHKAGRFRRFGLSNYAAWQVVDIYHCCKSNGWVLPTVYQVGSLALASGNSLLALPLHSLFILVLSYSGNVQCSCA